MIRHFLRIRSSIFGYDTRNSAHSRRSRGRAEARRPLAPDVRELWLEAPGVGSFAPGQFARLEAAETVWRDYSIVAIRDCLLRLLVSTRTGGAGSRFVAPAEAGDPVTVEFPLGRFTAPPSGRRRVFVATGTGLAPFLAMMDPARGTRDELVFGCRFAADDLTSLLDDPLPPVTRCRRSPAAAGHPLLTGEAAAGARRSRVTEALVELDSDLAQTEFYLRGSGAMVADASRLLARRGARFVFTEPY